MVRYTNLRFPGFKYIPKQGPHPSTRLDQIHIPVLPKSETVFSEQTWKYSNTYLYAIDLFNYSYYWEVHEVLEKLWIEAGKKSNEGFFLQGLIQLSVALLKRIQSNQLGANRLYEKAEPKLLLYSKVYLGIDIENLLLLSKPFIMVDQTQPPFISLKFA